MARRLPTPAETAEILSRKRTRPARRPPPVAGKSLAGYLKQLDSRFGGGATAPRILRERWREIVGETLARRTEPVRLVRSPKAGASLEVRVDGPAAALIQHQSADILSRVNTTLGEGAVARLRIVQGPLSARPAAPKKPARLPPLDAACEAELASSVEGAADDRLKAALLRLGREVMRRG